MATTSLHSLASHCSCKVLAYRISYGGWVMLSKYQPLLLTTMCMMLPVIEPALQASNILFCWPKSLKLISHHEFSCKYVVRHPPYFRIIIFTPQAGEVLLLAGRAGRRSVRQASVSVPQCWPLSDLFDLSKKVMVKWCQYAAPFKCDNSSEFAYIIL